MFLNWFKRGINKIKAFYMFNKHPYYFINHLRYLELKLLAKTNLCTGFSIDTM